MFSGEEKTEREYFYCSNDIKYFVRSFVLVRGEANAWEGAKKAAAFINIHSIVMAV